MPSAHQGQRPQKHWQIIRPDLQQHVVQMNVDIFVITLLFYTSPIAIIVEIMTYKKNIYISQKKKEIRRASSDRTQADGIAGLHGLCCGCCDLHTTRGTLQSVSHQVHPFVSSIWNLPTCDLQWRTLDVSCTRCRWPASAKHRPPGYLLDCLQSGGRTQQNRVQSQSCSARYWDITHEGWVKIIYMIDINWYILRLKTTGDRQSPALIFQNTIDFNLLRPIRETEQAGTFRTSTPPV